MARGRVPKSPNGGGTSRNPDGSIPISVETMYEAKTHKPYVDLILGSEGSKLDPDQARMIAGWLLEAAEAAEFDSVMVAVLTETGLEHDQAAFLMVQAREKRRRRRASVVRLA